MATIPGSPGAFARSSQLTMNSATMTTLVAPCHMPTALARVPEGIANQSPRERAWRVEVRPFGHPHAKTGDQLPPEETSQRGQDHPHKGEDDGDDSRITRSIRAEQPAHDENRQHDHVGSAVPHSDRFGPRTGGDRQPIDQAEHRRGQTTDNAGSNHPERDLRPFAVSCEQVNNVEDDRGREQAQWERDQDRMYRVSHYLGFTLHKLSFQSHNHRPRRLFRMCTRYCLIPNKSRKYFFYCT